jgi:hypothetical protein
MHFFSRASSFLALGKLLNALRTRDLGQPRSLTSPAIRASVPALGCIKHESPMSLRAGSRSKGPAPQSRRRNQHRSAADAGVPLVRAIRYGCDLASVIMGVRVALPQDFLCACTSHVSDLSKIAIHRLIGSGRSIHCLCLFVQSSAVIVGSGPRECMLNPSCQFLRLFGQYFVGIQSRGADTTPHFPIAEHRYKFLIHVP